MLTLSTQAARADLASEAAYHPAPARRGLPAAAPAEPHPASWALDDPGVAAALDLAARGGRRVTLAADGPAPAALPPAVATLARQVLRHGLVEAVAVAGRDGRIIVRAQCRTDRLDLRVHAFAGHVDRGEALPDRWATHASLGRRVAESGGRYAARPTMAGASIQASLPLPVSMGSPRAA